LPVSNKPDVDTPERDFYLPGMVRLAWAFSAAFVACLTLAGNTPIVAALALQAGMALFVWGALVSRPAKVARGRFNRFARG
jgi:hypothetical protein